MLTSELIRARKREGVLTAQYVQGDAVARLLPVVEAYLAIYRGMVGRSRDDLDAEVDAVEVAARDRVTALGLCKVLDDQCEYEGPQSADPEEVRRDVFLAAAAAQRALDVRAAFDRAVVLAAVAAARGSTPGALETVLYADLRGAEVLRKVWDLGAEALIERYNVALAQSILLRATKVTILVAGETPDRYRRLFRTMRFLGLLCRVTLQGEAPAAAPAAPAVKPAAKRGRKKKASDSAGGPPAGAVYSIVIDGPFSLFGPSQKYGMRLATLLHAVLGCERFSLDAEILWGQRRELATFRIAKEDGLLPHAAELPSSSPVLDAFVAGFAKLESPWRVAPSDRIFVVPGEAAIIPDLVFSNQRTGEEVFLEAFGFWSRAAVWTRVEQIRRGVAGAPLMLAVSKDLNVSDEVLGEGDAGEVYVYKETLRPRAVLERLERRGKAE